MNGFSDECSLEEVLDSTRHVSGAQTQTVRLFSFQDRTVQDLFPRWCFGSPRGRA